MTLLKYKFKSIVMNDWTLDESVPIFETKFGKFSILTTLYWTIVVGDWDLNEKSLSK